MSFSKDAVGFFLELNDSLSPAIKQAAKNYTVFTKQIDNLNKKAVKSANNSFAAMAALARSFAALPQQAARNYTRTFNALKRQVKPLKQPIDIIFSQKSFKNTFANSIVKALAKALSKITIKMSPALPSRRAKGFDTSEGLRTAYRHTVQPADMIGKMNVPKFKKGGIVKAGSREGIDDVLAALGKGEMILPAEYAKILRKMANRKKIPAQLSQGFADLRNLGTLMDKLSAKGMLTGREKKTLRSAVKLSGGASASMQAMVSSLPKDMQAALNMRLTKLNKIIGESADKSKALLKNLSMTAKTVKAIQTGFSGVKKILKGIQTDTSYIAFMEFWKNWKKDLADTRQHLGAIMGSDSPVKDFFDNMNNANRTWHTSRKELYDIRTQMIDLSNETPGVLNPTIMGQTVEAMDEAGIRLKTVSKYAGLVAISTQAMRMSVGTASALTRVFADNMKKSVKQTYSMMSAISKMSESGPQSADEIGQHMLENRRNMGAAFYKMDADQQGKALESLSKFGQAAQNQFADSNNHLGTMLSKAMSDQTSEEAIQVQRLTGMTGDQLKNALIKGDVPGIINKIADGIDRMGNDPTVLAKLAPLFGFQDPGEFIAFSKNRKSMLKDFNHMTDAIQKAADAKKSLEQDAADALNASEKWGNTITGKLYKYGQVVIDQMHDFNLGAAMGYLWLGKKIFQFSRLGKAATALGGTMKGLWPWIGSIFGIGKVSLPKLPGQSGGFLANTFSWIMKIARGALPAMGVAMTAIGTLATTIGGTIAGWAILAAPVLVPVLAIAAALGSIAFLGTEAYKNWDMLKDLFKDGSWGAIDKIADDLWTISTAKTGAITKEEMAEFKKQRHLTYVAPNSNAPTDVINNAVANKAAAAAAPTVSMSDDAGNKLMIEQNDLLKKFLGAALSGKSQAPTPLMPTSNRNAFMELLGGGE